MNFLRPRKPRNRAVLIGVSTLFVIVLGMAVYAETLDGKIRPGVLIAGLDVGGATLAQAEASLRPAIALYDRSGITVDVGENEVTVPTNELGLTFNLSTTLKSAYRHGRHNIFTSVIALPAFARADEPIDVALDEERFEALRTKIQMQFSRPAVEPTLTLQNGKAVVVNGNAGQAVTLPKANPDVLRQAHHLKPVVLAAEVREIKPKLSEDDLREAIPALENMIVAPVEVRAAKESKTISADDLGEWLTTVVDSESDNGWRFTIEEEQTAKFFEPLASTVYRAPKETFGFRSETDGEYAYKNSEGLELDLGATLGRLLETLEQPVPRTLDVVTRPVKAIITYQEIQAPKPTGKVIAVDLTRQAAFAFEDGKLKYWTRASTGKGGYKTPTGEWKVRSKTKKQVMDGPGYYLPNVKWVLQYNGDYTLHGTYWHADFGIPKSHGCTNLSEADAKWFFDWADVGTPVVIYESQGV